MQVDPIVGNYQLSRADLLAGLKGTKGNGIQPHLPRYRVGAVRNSARLLHVIEVRHARGWYDQGKNAANIIMKK